MSILLPPHNIPAEDIEEMTPKIREEIEMMKRMMKKNVFHGGLMRGFALAHPQVSEYPLSLFVTGGGKVVEKVVINPKIIERSGICHHKEACLSFPGRRPEKVVHTRYRRITVEYLEWNGDGVWSQKRERLDGLLAEIFQHEIEHLQGKNIYGWKKTSGC